MTANLNDRKRMFDTLEAWVSFPGFHNIFRYIWGLFVMILQILLIYRNWNFELKQYKSDNRYLFWFIIILTSFYMPMLIPGIFGAGFNLKWFSLHFIEISLSFPLLITTIYILFSPRILYGFIPVPRLNKELPILEIPIPKSIEISPVEVAAVTEISHRSHLNPGEVPRIIEKIEKFMEQSKPFLNPGYTIHELSSDIEIPVYQISPVINLHFDTNFSSWLNKYRVNYFIDLCNISEKTALTYEALSKEAGFSNRVTFINAFKKEKGTTPGNYLKNKLQP